MRIAILCATVALAVAGCNADDPHAKWFGLDAGTVHGHNHTDASYVPGSTSCSGNPPICTTSPGTYIPEGWQLDLYAPNGDHGWTSVEPRAYQLCHVGDKYPDCAR